MFFDDKNHGGGAASMILASNRDGKLEPTPEAGPDDPTLLAHELMAAIEKKDVPGVINALRSLSVCFSSEG